MTSSFDLEVTLPEAENISWKYPEFIGVNNQEFINELIVEPANADISSINVRTSWQIVTITQDSENPKLYHFVFSATATGYANTTITATLGELTATFKMTPQANSTFIWNSTGRTTWNTNTSTHFLILPEGADIDDVVVTSQLPGVLTVTQDSLNPTMFFVECNNATQRYFNQKVTATLNEDISEINFTIEWISDYSWQNSELSIINGSSANNRPITLSGESTVEFDRMTFTQNPEGFVTITKANSQTGTFAVSNLEEDTDITISGNLYGVIKTFTIHATVE